MMTTWLFARKELVVAWRRHRVLLVGALFLLFGLQSPLIAKLTPDLMRSVLGSDLPLKLPTPTSVDSWTQFYKNLTQLGLFLVALVFSNTVSQAVSRGTLVNLVTKGLPRYAVILAKYLVAAGLWLSALLMSFGVTWAYTRYYFPDDLTPHVWRGLLPLALFGLLLLALTVLGSALTRSSFTGFLAAAAGFVTLSLIGLIPAAHRFDPLSLAQDNLALVTGSKALHTFVPAMGLSVALIVICLGLAIWRLNRTKL
ncbi:ABC transporter permease [Lacticaseibacillus absianus]|uniref:ABC transporter permease n=1 Tax=Lacticaseibacillus absianus TaxID=2729623 RepID=UPI0015CD0B0B|nr:ABC transporter permease subunit [Lacticaseibacillus absianus]